MIIEDDRTSEQRQSHRWGVVMRDKFMSGWGEASGGVSRCAWACGPGVNIERVRAWVESRGDSAYVNVVDLHTYRPRNTKHFHIYVCDAGHPALD
jgi:hypothetical protein